MAKLYFRYGAMNSGKTTALIQVAFNYKERGMRVLILKPSIDTKGKDCIVSRLGVECKVDQLVTPEMNILDIVRADCDAHGAPACVLCDESQFLTPAQAEQLFLVTVDWNIPVICYGLRADFMLRGFPGSTRLLELAHTIEEMKTICACGRKATCNGRKINGKFVFEGDQVAIDMVGNVEYQSLCPQCWYREYRAFLKERRQGSDK
ncbi:MAG: thymidine kinase [Gemmiger sp.]|uniref:thymidine kinase n=1 Tax=Gemmiger sp. TaxID=2049027 RepID=UPI002E76FA33|nr:thymidine kinase [Gemmiger sp.]MEE0801909.1 thymidine kinase [Gemmiger sp.]